ncbi:MAG: HipA domain-containing protein [Desulfobacteraceae bacterium]|nr:HipA domain-containing protein [Desulfobacteraceae bacterium]MBC2757301.1 HipA domain-containing protein [Desulfobacteraceae bacterium]
MAEKKITVFIYLPGETVAVPAGILTYDSDLKVGSFAYGRRYIERKNALPVDPVALPIGPPPQEVMINKGLYGSFRDATPDFWGRLVIAAERKVPPEALSETDFLLETNATRVGNLDFRLSLNDPEPTLKPPHFNQMEQVLDSAARIEAGEEVSNHLLRLLYQGSSVGGARPKCTVEWKNTLWIAKFPSMGDTLDIPRIEYATMSLAESCGIRIPELLLESAGEKNILLVRRFDREKKGRYGWARKGFLSALSLMQWDENDRLLWDYRGIADIMRRYSTAVNIQELFCRMVFNILVRNTDDHPRNHGFLFSGDRLELSPAYDIVPSLTQPGVDTDFNLAMSVGENGREASLKNALSHAARFAFSLKAARAIVEHLVEITRGWREHFETVGCSDREIKALEPSFARCENVDLLSRIP